MVNKVNLVNQWKNVAHEVRRYEDQGLKGQRCRPVCPMDATGRQAATLQKRRLGGAPPRLCPRAIVVFARRRNQTSLAELLNSVPANGVFRLRRISAFLPQASCGIPQSLFFMKGGQGSP
ncbi:hypothetical protein KAX17_08115 [Candidatus Bipolaricaulota bacterium]|nr:hypothetical protein [Candidatus Bipolaricaulota bacterium]